MNISQNTFNELNALISCNGRNVNCKDCICYTEDTGEGQEGCNYQRILQKFCHKLSLTHSNNTEGAS